MLDAKLQLVVYIWERFTYADSQKGDTPRPPSIKCTPKRQKRLSFCHRGEESTTYLKPPLNWFVCCLAAFAFFWADC